MKPIKYAILDISDRPLSDVSQVVATGDRSKGEIKMTRKDYELIAKLVKNLKDEVVDDLAHEAIVTNFIEELQCENPRFNSEIFAKACGL